MCFICRWHDLRKGEQQNLKIAMDNGELPPSPAGFLMSAHLSRLRLFQRHLRSLVWVGVWVWDWIHSHTPPRTRSPSSHHPLFTHYPIPLRSLVCGGQPSPHKPRLVVSHSTYPPLSSSPHTHSFVIGPAVINTHARVVRTDSARHGHEHIDRSSFYCSYRNKI